MNDLRAERLQVMLSPEELAAVDDFRFKHRMPTRAAAVRELLKFGLAAAGIETSSGPSAGIKSSEFRGFWARPGGHTPPHPERDAEDCQSVPSKRPRHGGCQGRPWRLLPDHRGHDNRKQSVDSSRRDSFLRNSRSARRRNRPASCRSPVSWCCRSAWDRALLRATASPSIRLVHGLRALLVARLIFRPLVLDDAVVGMRHDVLSPLQMS